MFVLSAACAWYTASAMMLKPAAGRTVLAGAVATLALVYGRLYLESAARLFDALFLIMCGAVCGFVMSGDLFNIFVWLELMGVAAYALTGFEIRDIGPLQVP